MAGLDIPTALEDRCENTPKSRDLPALRSNADLAWGFWNRLPHNTPTTAFWGLSADSEQILGILNLAITTYRPPPWHTKVDSIQEWPGTDFDITSVEAVAILGSPSGVAVGFFLAQHKQQRGGDKMISKITVFKARQPFTDDDYPTMIFWVRDAPNLYGEVGGARLADVSNVGAIGVIEGLEEKKVLRRGVDGRSVLREHVIRVGL